MTIKEKLSNMLDETIECAAKYVIKGEKGIDIEFYYTAFEEDGDEWWVIYGNKRELKVIKDRTEMIKFLLWLEAKV